MKEANDAKNAARQAQRDDRKAQKKALKDGDRQFQQMDRDQKEPIDKWKGFRSGDSESASGPSTSVADAGTSEAESSGKLVLKKRKKTTKAWIQTGSLPQGRTQGTWGPLSMASPSAPLRRADLLRQPRATGSPNRTVALETSHKYPKRQATRN